mmetsp:Transcript_12490/g.35770  ORF Transcript_12490/g.35770 Transcript_12490/m.35770 type:complete len:236 (-) Transcript_12490:242-949(-)
MSKPASSNIAVKLMLPSGVRILHLSEPCGPPSTLIQLRETRRERTRAMYSPRSWCQKPLMVASPDSLRKVRVGAASRPRNCLMIDSAPWERVDDRIRLNAPGDRCFKSFAFRASKASRSRINANKLWASTVAGPSGGTRSTWPKRSPQGSVTIQISASSDRSDNIIEPMDTNVCEVLQGTTPQTFTVWSCVSAFNCALAECGTNNVGGKPSGFPSGAPAIRNSGPSLLLHTKTPA